MSVYTSLRELGKENNSRASIRIQGTLAAYKKEAQTRVRAHPNEGRKVLSLDLRPKGRAKSRERSFLSTLNIITYVMSSLSRVYERRFSGERGARARETY